MKGMRPFKLPPFYSPLQITPLVLNWYLSPAKLTKVTIDSDNDRLVHVVTDADQSEGVAVRA